MQNARHAADTAAMHRPLPADLFAGMLALSADAVIGVDHAQRIVFFNVGAERIFGWTADEIVGHALEELLPQRFRPAHHSQVTSFGDAQGHARLMGHRQTISGLRKSGEEFPAEASIQQFTVNGDHMYAAILRDMTERKKAEDALRAAVTARDDMIGIVSHDLRNPANAVKMLAQSILANTSEVPPTTVEHVRIILQASQQIDALIQDLLDITRIDAGRLRVSPVSTEIAELLSLSLEPMRPLFAASQMSVTVTVDPLVTSVRADTARIAQVISNLLGNSLKFTEAGGNIDIAVRRAGEMVEFEVRDNGIGIPREQLPHVFDRFFQSAQVGQSRRHGAGLGLPISRGIVSAHGGTLWIESEVGKGTIARFRLHSAD